MSRPESGNRTPGFCAWFTGLSGAGKTTTAELLQGRLEEEGRRVTMLDGDVVREHLSKGLGFSRADRDTNVLRVGFVASQIAYHGGIAICSLISPYRETRNQVRAMFPEDNFVEVHVATPLDVCEKRDTKGLYQRARIGEIREFTGISDPYEPPLAPEMTLNTTELTVEQNVEAMMIDIIQRGFLRRSA